MTKLRVWCIGSDRTEYFAAFTEESLREFYTKMVGLKQANEDFAEYFEEVPESAMDAEFDFDNGGTMIRTSWRKMLDEYLAEGCQFPAQVSSSYI